MVQCFRNNVKCKSCNEIIQRDNKKKHLNQWRDLRALKDSILAQEEEKTKLFFEHGVKADVILEQELKQTPIHLAA